jgi:hypothetical protein
LSLDKRLVGLGVGRCRDAPVPEPEHLFFPKIKNRHKSMFYREISLENDSNMRRSEDKNRDLHPARMNRID